LENITSSKFITPQSFTCVIAIHELSESVMTCVPPVVLVLQFEDTVLQKKNSYYR